MSGKVTCDMAAVKDNVNDDMAIDMTTDSLTASGSTMAPKAKSFEKPNMIQAMKRINSLNLDHRPHNFVPREHDGEVDHPPKTGTKPSAECIQIEKWQWQNEIRNITRNMDDESSGRRKLRELMPTDEEIELAIAEDERTMAEAGEPSPLAQSVSKSLVAGDISIEQAIAMFAAEP